MKLDKEMASICSSCLIGYLMNYPIEAISFGLLGSFILVNVLGDLIDRYRQKDR